MGDRAKLSGGLGWAGTAAVLGVAVFLAGCGPKPRPVPAALSLQETVRRYNANVAEIDRFRAKVRQWKVKGVDEQGESFSHGHMGGTVFYVGPKRPGAPAHLNLQPSLPAGAGQFVVGSNDREFWMYITPKQEGWWGKYAHVGKPCAGHMPISPQVLLQFIGCRSLPDPNSHAVYKVGEEVSFVEYIVETDEGLQIYPELVFDRRTDLPRQITAYDCAGEVVLQSKLEDYQPLGDAMLPGRIEISAPPYELRLRLGGFQKPKKRFHPALFKRPEPGDIPEVMFQQIDEECDDEK